jgi:sporulation protein YlmC with PRC-barrel domain
MLKEKKVKTNDGKDIGEIKQVSQNFLCLEKGTVKKDKLWIPKYVADAYDGDGMIFNIYKILI